MKTCKDTKQKRNVNFGRKSYIPPMSEAETEKQATIPEISGQTPNVYQVSVNGMTTTKCPVG
jgi:hypothetical protein